MHFIIDGYNLIKRNRIDDECGGDMEEARDMVTTSIENSFSRKNPKDRALIIYDSKFRQFSNKNYNSKYLKIKFASANTADNIINKELKAMSEEQRKGVTVVSSDIGVRERAMFLFAKHMSSEDFWNSVS